MQGFLSAIASTVYNPAFYARVRRESLDRPIKYTAALGIIGAGILIALIYIALIPFSSTAFLDKVAGMYPNDLVITLANGALSINQPEPYYVKNTFNAKGPQYLAIFDTGDTLGGGAKQNNTYVLIKKTYAVAQESGGERATYFNDVATSSTTTITKADVTGFIDKVRPYAKPVILIGGLFGALLGTALAAAIWLGFHLLYLLIPAVIIFLYGRFSRPPLPWKESYIVAIYASIPVAIATYLLHLAGFAWPVFFYTLLVILVALINLAQRPAAAQS